MKVCLIVQWHTAYTICLVPWVACSSLCAICFETFCCTGSKIVRVKSEGSKDQTHNLKKDHSYPTTATNSLLTYL